MQAIDPKRKRPKEMAAAGLLGEFSILFQEMAAREQLPVRWSSGLPLSANLQFFHPAGQQTGFYDKRYQ